jgi:signal transduction histidine kinase/CheY-like chemotaxis protein
MSTTLVYSFLDSFIPPYVPGTQNDSSDPEDAFEEEVCVEVQSQMYVNRFRFLVCGVFGHIGITTSFLSSAYIQYGIHGWYCLEGVTRLVYFLFLWRSLYLLPRRRIGYNLLQKILIFYTCFRIVSFGFKWSSFAWIYLALSGFNTAIPVMVSGLFKSVSPQVKFGLTLLYFAAVFSSVAKGWGTSITIDVSYHILLMVIVQILVLAPTSVYVYMNDKNKMLLMNELQEMVKKARAASEAKTMFISNISHDLRTPIHAILSLITLIEESCLDSVQRSYVATMKSSCYHLTSVINNVLDFAKIENDKMDFSSEEVDLFTVVQNVTDSISSLAEEKDLTLLIDLTVPSGYRYAKCDEKGLSRVLTNLLGNAVKFTERGHVKLKIMCKQGSEEQEQDEPHPLGKEETAEYIFEVEDSGRGMTQEFIETKLFNPFTQENNFLNAKGREGTGLGLSLSQRIVNKLGGKIRAHSIINEGTTFSFTLSLQVVKREGSMGNLALLKELIPFEVSTYVNNCGLHDQFILRMIENEVEQWSGILTSPRLVSSEKVQETKGSILFLIDLSSSLCNEQRAWWDDRVKGLPTHLEVSCYILISRARKESFLNQNELIKVLQSRPGAKVVSVLLPMTPLKIHRAISSCITHLRTLGGTSSEGAVFHQPKEVPVDLTKIHVLVAEDNVMIATVLSKLFRKTSIQHTIANHGEMALQLWSDNPDTYGLILMDIQMPIMDGFTAVQKIRALEVEHQRRTRIGIIFMSANASVEEITYARSIGGDEYLTKPVEFNVLLKAMRDIVASTSPSV